MVLEHALAMVEGFRGEIEYIPDRTLRHWSGSSICIRRRLLDNCPRRYGDSFTTGDFYEIQSESAPTDGECPVSSPVQAPTDRLLLDG